MLGLVLALLAGIGLGVGALVGALTPDGQVPSRTADSVTDREIGDPDRPPTDAELANPVDCRPRALSMDLALPGGAARAGDQSAFEVTVVNTGQVPCLLDLGGEQLSLTVVSGDDTIWDSRHCGGTGSRRILLDVGDEDARSLTWPGTRSAEGCPGGAATAKAGSYRAVATLVVPAAEGVEPTVVAESEQSFTVR